MSEREMPFSGLIPDSIDLSQYLEPEQSTAVRPAHHFADKAIDILSGRKEAKGLPLPWSKKLTVCSPPILMTGSGKNLWARFLRSLIVARLPTAVNRYRF